MDPYVESLADRGDVRFEREVTRLDESEFEETRERAAEIRGGVAVATLSDRGVLLVTNEWMDGYGLPGGGVEPGEDWEAAAVREVREETGVRVDLDRPWLVERQAFEHDGQQCGGGHTVFYLASPRPGERIADDPGVEDEVIEDVAWFQTVPEECVQPERIRTALDGQA